ncbi:MAG: hypothetical protein E7271_12735 [Lachnospiraceae bacterium]|nr:hypothetical protein [Lachnospiraceae bacterium]
MQSAQVLDVKNFMQLLLQSEAFDTYETVEAVIRTDMTYSIDGKLNRDFYSEDELSAMFPEDISFVTWQYAKPKVFDIIKGKRTPSYMKIVFKVNKAALDSVLNADNSSHNSNNIAGVYFNITFKEQILNVTCSVSYKNFTLDKNLELEIFSNFTTLLKSNNIAIN